MRVNILAGDAKARLRELPEKSVHCIVTSPPYWGLRSYHLHDADGRPVAGGIGLEPSFEAYAENLVAVFRECWRVLRDDGTLWLNLGDAYAGSGRGAGTKTPGSLHKTVKGQHGLSKETGRPEGLKPKDLMLMPARIAMALQADGWHLRSEIVWAKKNAMPESVKDRPTSSHEKVFLLTKQPRYYYDHVAVRTPIKRPEDKRQGADGMARPHTVHPEHLRREELARYEDGVGRRAEPGGRGDGGHRSKRTGMITGANLRNVWWLSTQSFRGTHFATFPERLVEPCIKAGTSPQVCSACGTPYKRITGTGSETLGWRPSCECNAESSYAVVLDPFGGSGTVALSALKLRRNATIVELSGEYALLAHSRISGFISPLLGDTIEIDLQKEVKAWTF